MSEHDFYMTEALKIAFSRIGKTSPNPPVGAVIVKDGSVISRGGTCEYGCDHAEIDAIKNACADLNGAHLYVTLEPCCHYGKTPPCTQTIIKSGISRVYAAIADPNPLVAGKGIEQLRNAGIEALIMEEMAGPASELIRPFKKYILKSRPYIIHKAALTLDGKTAAISGDSKWISSEYSRYLTHRLRSLVDAVIIGKNTFEKDNPALNSRLDSFPEEVKDYFLDNDFSLSGENNFFLKMLLTSKEPFDGANPCRVIAGIPENILMLKNIFFDDNILLFIEKKIMNDLAVRQDYKILKKYDDCGKIVPLNGSSYKERIDGMLKELHKRGIMCAMLEGGGKLAGSFFNSGEIDQFLYFIAPKVMGNGLPVMDGRGAMNIKDAPKLRHVSSVMIKDDLIYNAYLDN